jgi:hypothetical protein
MNKPRWNIYESNKITIEEREREREKEREKIQKEKFTEIKNIYNPQTEKPIFDNLNYEINSKINQTENLNYTRRKRFNYEISKNEQNSDLPLLRNLTNEQKQKEKEDKDRENYNNNRVIVNVNDKDKDNDEDKYKFDLMANGSDKKNSKEQKNFNYNFKINDKNVTNFLSLSEKKDSKFFNFY